MRARQRLRMYSNRNSGGSNGTISDVSSSTQGLYLRPGSSFGSSYVTGKTLITDYTDQYPESRQMFYESNGPNPRSLLDRALRALHVNVQIGVWASRLHSDQSRKEKSKSPVDWDSYLEEDDEMTRRRLRTYQSRFGR